MELEGVGAVAVHGGVGQVRGDVDNLDGLEGAALLAEGATDAEFFGELGHFGGGFDGDAMFALHVDGASFFAFECALFGFAQIGVHDGDTSDL